MQLVWNFENHICALKMGKTIRITANCNNFRPKINHFDSIILKGYEKSKPQLYDIVLYRIKLSNNLFLGEIIEYQKNRFKIKNGLELHWINLKYIYGRIIT